jgi:hypothetical protein
MPTVGFEHTIPESGRPQTYALDRAAAAIGCIMVKLRTIIRVAPGSNFRNTPDILIEISVGSTQFPRPPLGQ